MPMMPKPFLIRGPRFCLEGELTQSFSHGLLCSGGRIQKILNFEGGDKTLGPNLNLGINVDVVEFPEDYLVLPGFIDLHIHGAEGFDVMDGTPEALEKVSAALLREGTTGFFATTMTESSEKIFHALKNIAESKNHGSENLQQQLLGVHLEGPFLAQSRMGAQCGEKLVAPDISLFEQFNQASDGQIKLVTLAVETAKALDFIQYLVEKNIVASIGHTDATFQEAMRAIDAGASYSTHLFNAMRGIHHREPGCACAILMDDRVSAELIVDGIHLHPDMVKFALHVKGTHKVILVTDAMRAQCLGDGVFDLGGQQVEVKGKEARLASGALAGSVLTLREALLNTKKFTGLDWVELSRLTSANPAKIAGCFKDRGSLSVGKRADLVVLNSAGEILSTFLGGKRVN
jgi:N-acetylglucosamine-6-phosphate deacetylase